MNILQFKLGFCVGNELTLHWQVLTLEELVRGLIAFKNEKCATYMLAGIGHKDKNNTSLFLGDIVEVPYKYRGKLGTYEAVIVFKNNCFTLSENKTKLIDQAALVLSKKMKKVGDVFEKKEYLDIFHKENEMEFFIDFQF